MFWTPAFAGVTIGGTFYEFIKLVDRIFYRGLTRARKERQIAPQASAGYPLPINPLLAFRKAERGVGIESFDERAEHPRLS
jgi:hypothetical protein